MTPSTEVWILAAPAKVNLRLEVLGRRADGYHELSTTLVALDWHDRVTLTALPRPGIELYLGGPACSGDVPADSGNLVWRAAEAFFEGSEQHQGVRIELHKELPSRAGLGGGSADAAATLMGLEGLFEEQLEDGDLRLAQLGSDTVFFRAARRSGYAHAGGRGEAVTPLPLPAVERWFAIATPAAEVSTAEAYRRLGLLPGDVCEPAGPLQDWLALPLQALRGALFNGLEQAALDCSSGVRRFRELLDGIGLGHWRLAGSGASFFGVYALREEAELDLLAVERTAVALGEPLRAQRVCRPLGSGPYRLSEFPGRTP